MLERPVSWQYVQMRPLQGMTAIAEFGTRWEANVAVARLRDAGLEAAVLVDPATEVAPHHVTDRLAVVVVRSEAADRASLTLKAHHASDQNKQLDAAYFQRRFADRPAWVRYATWALVLAIPVPFAVSAIALLWIGVEGLFP